MNKFLVIAVCLIIASSQGFSQNKINITNKNFVISKQRKASLSSPKPTMTVSGLSTKQPAPPFTYTVWDESGIICILAKFEAFFTIIYDVKGGTQQINERVPIDATSKGRCDFPLDEKPTLDVSWIGGFTLRIIFEKVDETNWSVYSIEFLYNTADSSFHGSTYGSKKLAKTAKGSLGMFVTPFGKSYMCPSPKVLNLYEGKTDRHVVILRLANVQLQPFQIERGKFSPINRCSQVGFGSGVQVPIYVSLEQDDSVPFIVGSITIMVSILVVVGYAVYKSWLVRRVDYDTMG